MYICTHARTHAHSFIYRFMSAFKMNNVFSPRESSHPFERLWNVQISCVTWKQRICPFQTGVFSLGSVINSMHKIICNILLSRTTKRGKMDLNSPAQDVVICELCFTPEVHLLCESCHAYLYQSCVGDQPLFYRRVQGPFNRQRKKPVCLRCQGSLEHIGNTISISSEVLESSIKNI